MIEKINVKRVVEVLDEPFAMANVALVGDIVVSIYICQGKLRWHRHPEKDELFWVHEGLMALDSEWGNVQLRSGELAVVPKGVEHRSHSTARASVVLLSGGFMSERKNGRHRLYAIPGEAHLSPVNLARAVERHATHFRFRTVARLEEAAVQTAQGTGTWPIQVPGSHSALYFVLRGSATVTTSQAFLHLHPGEFTVVPEGVLYRLSTTRDTALVRIIHADALE